jgi:glycosyltransferase involved in cell wall biosynthesis
MSMLRAAARRRVVFLESVVFRDKGGIQNVCRDQVRALLTAPGAPPVTVLVLHDSNADVRNAEWHGVAATGYSGRRLRFCLGAVRRVFSSRPRLVIIGHRGFLPLAPWIRAAAPRASIWLKIYGVDTAPRLKRLEHACLRFVDRVVSISPNTSAQFRDAGFEGEIVVLPCGLPHYWGAGEPSPSRFESPVKLLAVSRLSALDRYKGIDHTIEAVALLRRRGHDVRLDVVGSGDDLPRLAGLAEAQGVADCVCFQGRVSDERLAELYGAADVFVLPSGGEGFGLVYLEAMAYGKPIVAADSAGAPFVVRPGESGRLVPFGDVAALHDCLERLIGDPRGARELGLGGRQLLEKEFTFERFSRRFLGLVDGEREHDE